MMLYDVIKATLETVSMVTLSTLGAIILGLPLGILLFATERVRPHPKLHHSLNMLVNFSRSIPFIILLVALIPFTRLLVGTSIGMLAAIVPLTMGAIPFFARLVDNVYQRLPQGLLEAAEAMGASPWQTIYYILLPESVPGLIHAMTITAITLVGYSAMAGTVGGGGLGDLAIRYGYQRFDPMMMVTTVLILVIVVQLLQWLGDFLVRKYTH